MSHRTKDQRPELRIHVAELVRFPERVVNMARRNAEELEDFSSARGGGKQAKEQYSKKRSMREAARQVAERNADEV